MGVLLAIADVILILAALLSLIAFAFLAYAGYMTYRLVKEVKGEVTTVSDAAKGTLAETQETVRFVSRSIVKPASIVVGYASAIRATAKTLTEEAVKRSQS